MSLIKKRKKRVIKEAKDKLNSIISHTSDLSENDWDDEEVRDSIKKALCEFHGLIKKGKLNYIMQDQDIKNNVCLPDCDVDDDIADEFIPICLATIPILLDKLSLKLNTLDK